MCTPTARMTEACLLPHDHSNTLLRIRLVSYGKGCRQGLCALGAGGCVQKCQSCLMRRWRATAAASTVSLLLGMFPRCVASHLTRLTASRSVQAVLGPCRAGHSVAVRLHSRAAATGLNACTLNGAYDELCLLDARTMCICICASGALTPCSLGIISQLLMTLGRQISLGRNRFGALNAAATAGGPPPRALSPQAREAARRVYSAGR